MKRRQVLKAAVALTVGAGMTACVGGGTGVEFHRSKKRTLSSTTRFDAARFAGRWVIRGEFVYPGETPSFGAVNFAQSGGKITALDVYGPGGLLERYPAKQPAVLSGWPHLTLNTGCFGSMPITARLRSARPRAVLAGSSTARNLAVKTGSRPRAMCWGSTAMTCRG